MGSVDPESFDTLHSFSNAFEMPFVTPWYPEKIPGNNLKHSTIFFQRVWDAPLSLPGIQRKFQIITLNTLQSFSNAFEMPFVTSWYPEKIPGNNPKH